MVERNNTSLESMASLSALIDGEATNDDIEHLLQCDSAELDRRLMGYHLIRHSIHKEPLEFTLGDSLLHRVRSGVEAELDQTDYSHIEPDNNVIHVTPKLEKRGADTNKTGAFRWPTFLSGMAVAASISFIVVLGNQMAFFAKDTQANLLANVNVSPKSMVITPLTQSTYHPVQFDEVRLQHYLRQHAEQATMTVGQGMIPMARIVSYPNTN